jgi:thymidylate synthase
MYILQDYDDILEDIITNGFLTTNRTGVDTLTLFGTQGRYKIDEYFPLPTKRKYAYKSIFAELLWMISGSTNVNDLEKMGSKIWTAWRDKSFEEKNGYDDGELGPIYGWQMRNFGGDYNSRHYYSNSGFDQIEFIINELKTNKFSRRIIMNLWNPNDMISFSIRLPCCHYSFQLLVDNNDNLTGILTQRSGDWLPGVSANIFFYSAFLYMIAQQTNLKPYMLIHNTANSHVYVDQIDGAKEYLQRQEISSPKLVLNKAKDIFSYTLDDFNIIDYNPLPKIKIPVAV